MKPITKKIFTAFFLMTAFAAYSKEITVSIGAGKNWKEKREPQVAVWLEDSAGNFVKTLYITQRAGKKNWIFASKDGRPESLPVYYHSSQNAPSNSGKDKSPSKEQLDAVTSATSKGGIIFSAKIDDGKKYIIKVELNNSFDYNDFYTKKKSGVNGQPSVVYTAVLEADFSSEIKLELSGTGSLDGKTGRINPDTKHLTTAKNITSLVAVVPKK
ncbi:MAG: DUF2271 domain-containing protein [Treponema sp.]